MATSPSDIKQHAEVVEKLSASLAGFAINFLKKVRSRSSGNIIFSPWSIATSLAMCYVGCRNETAKQLKNILKFDVLPTDDDVHAAFEEMSLSLSRKEQGIVLNIANRIYLQQDYNIVEKYLELVVKHYNTEVGRVDFTNNAENERLSINRWVKDATKGKILDLLPSGALNALTRAVIVNALYFKGDWSLKFDKANTTKGKFYLRKDETVEVDMMHQENSYMCSEIRALNCIVIQLPYSGKMSMVLVLPNSIEGLQIVEDNLNEELLRSALSSFRRTKAKLTIPKFRMEETLPLSDVLVGMGISDLFNEGKADLTGISEKGDLYVSTAVHKAFLEVNEEGSVAAAASGFVIMARSLPMPPPMITFDHPFLLFIMDDVTGAILLMSSVTNPSI